MTHRTSRSRSLRPAPPYILSNFVFSMDCDLRNLLEMEREGLGSTILGPTKVSSSFLPVVNGGINRSLRNQGGCTTREREGHPWTRGRETPTHLRGSHRHRWWSRHSKRELYPSRTR